jgi:hypothetical protein
LLDENLSWLRLIYAAADGPEARDVERRVLDKMVRLTTETYQDDANDWSTRMLLKALLLSANHLLDHHDPQGAFRHLKDAGDVLGRWEFEEQSAENLQAWADYHETTSLMFLYLDRPTEALQQSEALIGIAERMESLSPGVGHHTIMQATGSHRAAMLSFRLQDGVAARRHFDAALSVHRTIVDEMGVAGMESNLLDVVMEYSGFLTVQGENPEAAALLADAAARARRLVHDADLAIHRRTLAGVLLRQAQTERLGGRLDTAREAAREALSLCERDEDHDSAPEAYLPTLHAELAELELASGTAADALAHATQSRERALAELQRRASMPGRGRLLRATALLVDAQQRLGHYRDAELTLRDAEAQVQAFDAEERSRFVDYIQRLAAASTAQPSLS